MSNLESTFALHLRACGVPTPEQQYRWAAALVGSGKGLRRRLHDAGLRDWRFDFAWPARMVAVEIEGGTWQYGRHNRPTGFAADCEKYNAATLCGWRVFRFTGDMVKSGDAVEVVAQALGVRND